MRESFNIPKKYNDNMILCKFGHSNDISRRNNEHSNTYGKIAGSCLRNKKIIFIDEIHRKEAEKDVKEYVKDNDISYSWNDDKGKNHIELIIISEGEMMNLEKFMNFLEKVYAGKYQEICHELKLRDKDIVNKDEKIMMLEENNRELKQDKEELRKDKFMVNDKLIPLFEWFKAKLGF